MREDYETKLREIEDYLNERAEIHTQTREELNTEGVPIRRRKVFDDIQAERIRQDEKFGPVTRHPDVDPRVLEISQMPEQWCVWHMIPTENVAKSACDEAYKAGCVSFTHIVVEELCEAVAKAYDIAAMREELVQVAASVVKWIEAVDMEIGSNG